MLQTKSNPHVLPWEMDKLWFVVHLHPRSKSLLWERLLNERFKRWHCIMVHMRHFEKGRIFCESTDQYSSFPRMRAGRDYSRLEGIVEWAVVMKLPWMLILLEPEPGQEQEPLSQALPSLPWHPFWLPSGTRNSGNLGTKEALLPPQRAHKPRIAQCDPYVTFLGGK